MSGINWFALRVISQRETMVQKILRYDGLKAFVKTEQRLRRKTKRDAVRKPVPFCAASGYVFVGLPVIPTRGTDDHNPWRLVRKLHLIRSVVSLDGQPVQLDPEALGAFLGYDDFDTPDYFKFFRTGQAEFQIGDRVRISSPAFDGFELPVKDIQRGECIFDLVMLGRQSEIRIPIEHCYRAA